MRNFVFGVLVGAVIGITALGIGVFLTADTGDGQPDAEAGHAAVEEAPPEPVWPTIRDADPADWFECMDRVFEMSNHVQYLYSNQTVMLSDERDIYTKNNYPIANMVWYIAVCDRMFPEDP